MNILVLHGINLNMFGKRDPAQYGTTTLAEIDLGVIALGKELGAQVETFQTNFEGAFVQRIHQAHADGTDAVIINAGAWTHYSYGIRDALAVLTCPITSLTVTSPTLALNCVITGFILSRNLATSAGENCVTIMPFFLTSSRLAATAARDSLRWVAAASPAASSSSFFSAGV